MLELGTAHGVGAAYMAAALADNGGGSLTTVDFAGAAYDPAPEEVLARAGVADRVTVVREFSSYTWWLKEQVAARSDAHGNVEPRFDFVYLDGAKNWTIDGLAVVLVEKLLRPGGWLLLDDLDWTYSDDPARAATDGVANRDLSEPRAHGAAPARGVRPDRRAAPVVHRAARAGRVVGLGAQGAGRAAPLHGRDVAPARRTRRRRRPRAARRPPARAAPAARRRGPRRRGRVAPRARRVGRAPRPPRLTRAQRLSARPQRGEREHGLRGVLALVALAAAGARQRLLHVLDREHAERARDAGRELHVPDPARRLGADVVVVVGLAADHGPEAGDARVAPALGEVLRRRRQLERARHVVDVGLPHPAAANARCAPATRRSARSS